MRAKTERVLAALSGTNHGRVPFAAWMHLGTQHLEPSESAWLHERFFRRFDLDLMKVMNDYPYPYPAGVEQVDGVDAMRRFEPLGSAPSAFDQQLEVIRLLRTQLGPDVIILDTVFNPFGVAQVMLKRSFDPLVASNPDDVADFLAVIAESSRNYVAASLGAGASGVFYSVNGARVGALSEPHFQRFVRELDQHVLSACHASTMNVCHAHGEEPRVRDLLDYPVHAFSWSHLTTTPSIDDVRTSSDACVIGGIDEHLTIVRRQPSEIRDDIVAAAQQAGRASFIVGPGCSLATETPVRLIDAARRAVDDL